MIFACDGKYCYVILHGNGPGGINSSVKTPVPAAHLFKKRYGAFNTLVKLCSIFIFLKKQLLIFIAVFVAQIDFMHT